MRAAWEHLRHEAWFRRSVRTFLQAFLALLIPGALGFLNDLTQWAQGQGQTPFPDARSFAFIGVQAIIAGVIAVVTALWTKAEDFTGHALLRTVDPLPRPGERGAADRGVLLTALGVGLLFVYVFLVPHVLMLAAAVILIAVGIILLVTGRARL